MVTNKAILGFFVVLIVVILAIILIRKSPSFLARFKRGANTTISESLSPTPTPLHSNNGSVAGDKVPSNKTLCTAELKSKCTSDNAPVCGYERVVSGDGESSRSLTYKSACTYCSLYGSDDVLDLGDAKYYPQGYTVGACDAATK